MPNWWFSPSGRTRRPGTRLPVPGEIGAFRPAERERLGAWVALRLAYGLLLVGLVWLTVYLLVDPRFTVASVRVVGARLVPAEQVAAAAAAVGQNVYLMPTRGVEVAALTVKPLQRARVAVTWPNLVTLEVVERPAFAVWRAGGADYLVSEEGVVLAPSAGHEALRPRGGPVVADVDGPPVAVGDVVDGEALARASYLQEALESAGIGVRSFERTRAYGLVAIIRPGVSVAFGPGQDLREKVAVLGAVLKGVEGRQPPAQLVDLRITDHPYLR